MAVSYVIQQRAKAKKKKYIIPGASKEHTITIDDLILAEASVVLLADLRTIRKLQIRDIRLSHNVILDRVEHSTQNFEFEVGV